jgi:hypothetical protein
MTEKTQRSTIQQAGEATDSTQNTARYAHPQQADPLLGGSPGQQPKPTHQAMPDASGSCPFKLCCPSSICAYQLSVYLSIWPPPPVRYLQSPLAASKRRAKLASLSYRRAFHLYARSWPSWLSWVPSGALFSGDLWQPWEAGGCVSGHAGCRGDGRWR